jgi:small subunit ribosomal protein S12e
MSALRTVLRTALIHDGLARGLKEAVKALDRREAVLAVLAIDCDEPSYSKLIGSFCLLYRLLLASCSHPSCSFFLFLSSQVLCATRTTSLSSVLKVCSAFSLCSLFFLCLLTLRAFAFFLCVTEKQQLGEWAGLCRYAPADQKAIKVVACSCVVVKSWGEVRLFFLASVCPLFFLTLVALSSPGI